MKKVCVLACDVDAAVLRTSDAMMVKNRVWPSDGCPTWACGHQTGSKRFVSYVILDNIRQTKLVTADTNRSWRAALGAHGLDAHGSSGSIVRRPVFI